MRCRHFARIQLSNFSAPGRRTEVPMTAGPQQGRSREAVEQAEGQKELWPIRPCNNTIAVLEARHGQLWESLAPINARRLPSRLGGC